MVPGEHPEYFDAVVPAPNAHAVDEVFAKAYGEMYHLTKLDESMGLLDRKEMGKRAVDKLRRSADDRSDAGDPSNN